jgi:putative hydrolase of the HAD superfamily
MQPIEAVTLDAAGTLIAPARPVAQTYAALAAPFGAQLDTRALGLAFRSQFAQMPPMAFGKLPAASVEVEERRWWRRLVEGVTREAGGVPAFDDYFEHLYAYFGTPAAWTVYDDVWPLLDGLKARAIPTAVVSNFDSRLLTVLDGLQLTGAFNAVVYSTQTGTAKPGAAIFASAAHQLRTPMPACVHIGDNPAADLEGARAAGMQARLVVREVIHNTNQDDIVVSLADALCLTG